jgi:predicted transposase YbfD/YdcC
MLEHIKKSLDEAYHGIKQGTSKITLRAEEKAKITRISIKVNSLQKEMDSILKRLGNLVYNFRTEKTSGDLFQDIRVQDILKEADNIHAEMIHFREEIDRIRQDYESKIKAVAVPEMKTGEEEGKTNAESGQQ